MCIEQDITAVSFVRDSVPSLDPIRPYNASTIKGDKIKVTDLRIVGHIRPRNKQRNKDCCERQNS